MSGRVIANLVVALAESFPFAEVFGGQRRLRGVIAEYKEGTGEAVPIKIGTDDIHVARQAVVKGA